MSSSYEEVMASKNFLPFRLDHLTSRMVRMADEELGENDNTRRSSIEQLRKLIIEEKNLKCRMDDEFLLQFLRARKFDVQNAFARLRTLFQVFYVTSADMFLNIDPEKATKAFGSGFGGPLPYRDREGAGIGFVRMGNWKLRDHDVYSMSNCAAALILTAADYPANQVCGLHLMVDCKGTSLQHLRCLRPRILYLASLALQGTMPLRFKSIHLINASTVFRCIWAVVNIFLSEKMRKRVHFHDNVKSLHKFIPKEILPKEYGGDIANFDPIQQSSEELEKFRHKYLQIIQGGCMKN